MINFKKLVVFDFETDGVNPHQCNPVQVAAIVINPRTLEILPDEFNSMMRPPNIDKDDYLTTDVKKTVDWHAKLRGVTSEDILEQWRNAPDQKFVWEQFVGFVNKHNPKGTYFTSPIPCGANIRNFDLVITKRLNEAYNIKDFFWQLNAIDVMDFTFYWFENLQDSPRNSKMDTLREYFGMSSDNAHDALQDVKDTAAILIKFLRLHRSIAGNVKFEGCFNEED